MSQIWKMCNIAEKCKKSHKNLAIDIKLCYNANGFIGYMGISDILMESYFYREITMLK